MINKNSEGSAGNHSISNNEEKYISYEFKIIINLLKSIEKGSFIKYCNENHDRDTIKKFILEHTKSNVKSVNLGLNKLFKEENMLTISKKLNANIVVIC